MLDQQSSRSPAVRSRAGVAPSKRKPGFEGEAGFPGLSLKINDAATLLGLRRFFNGRLRSGPQSLGGSRVRGGHGRSGTARSRSVAGRSCRSTAGRCRSGADRSRHRGAARRSRHRNPARRTDVAAVVPRALALHAPRAAGGFATTASRGRISVAVTAVSAAIEQQAGISGQARQGHRNDSHRGRQHGTQHCLLLNGSPNSALQIRLGTTERAG